MINDLIKYSAVTAKARAMYGKRLTQEQWDHLRASDSLRAMWDTLRLSDAWRVVGEDPACGGELSAMTKALARQLALDARHLCMFLDKEDSETFTFYLRRPGYMTPEEQKRWWRKGAKSAGLRRIAGAEADALNVVYLLRVRRFPASVKDAEELLIPVRDKLTDDIVKKLLRAPEDRDVMAVLANTPWAGVFSSLEPGELEKQFVNYMQAFCCRVLTAAQPGLVAAQAFMTIKEIERLKLTRLASALDRGISPELVV